MRGEKERSGWVGHGERGRMSTIWWKFLELTGQVLHLHLPCICMSYGRRYACENEARCEKGKGMGGGYDDPLSTQLISLVQSVEET